MSNQVPIVAYANPIGQPKPYAPWTASLWFATGVTVILLAVSGMGPPSGRGYGLSEIPRIAAGLSAVVILSGLTFRLGCAFARRTHLGITAERNRVFTAGLGSISVLLTGCAVPFTDRLGSGPVFWIALAMLFITPPGLSPFIAFKIQPRGEPHA